MKKILIFILQFFITFSVFSTGIAEFDIEQNKIPQKFTDNFLKKCEYDSEYEYYVDGAPIYNTDLGLYVLGWSKDGKIAYFEKQCFYPFGSDLYFHILDTVTDIKDVSIKFTGYDKDGIIDIKKCLRDNAEIFDEYLSEYKIILSPVTYENFPVKTNDSEINIQIDYKKIENKESCIEKKTYNIKAVKKNKYKILNTETDKICNTVFPVGYIKSPYENRIALIVINSKYTFEENAMFVSLYGCNLESGWKTSYEYSMVRRFELSESGVSFSRRWGIISDDENTFLLRFPLEDFEVKNFGDPDFYLTEDGFKIHFSWGGGNYFWGNTFYFKEINGIPYFYKVDSECISYSHTTEEYESKGIKTRILKNPIPITELTTEQICDYL